MPINFPLFFRFLLIATLCLLTIYLPKTIDQYYPLGNNLILNPQLDHDYNLWHGNKKVKTLNLIQVNNEKTTIKSTTFAVYLNQDIPLPQADFIQLSVNSSVSHVVQGDKAWQKAKIFLVGQVDGKNYWKSYLGLFSLVGTSDRHYYERTLSIPKEIDSLKVHIQLPKTNGILSFNSLNLYVVEKTLLYQIVNYALISLWIIILFGIILPVLRNKKWAHLAFIASIILFFVLVPATLRNELTFIFSDTLKTIFNISAKDSFFHYSFFKGYSYTLILSMIGHFLLFFFFSLIIIVFDKQIKIKSILAVILFAAASEIMQVFSVGRNPMLLDFYIDVGGILVACLFAISFKVLLVLASLFRTD